MDFTIKTYHSLIKNLLRLGFSFQTFIDFLEKPEKKVIILRHDVDRLPVNALEFAGIQEKHGIRGTYYFKAINDSWNEEIIRKIAEIGHEVGYHYEDLSVTAQRYKGIIIEEELVKLAIESFTNNIEKLRKITPVKTICMHGGPVSRWDNRLMWKYYDYRDFGISGEPYFDVNFNKVLYLTDTGRRWDGESVSIRDKVMGNRLQAAGGMEWEKRRLGEEDKNQRSKPDITLSASTRFHSTFNIIRAAETGNFPEKIMMTFHPQRWTNKPIPWVKELIWQNIKNIGKYFLIRLKAEGGSRQV